MGSPNNIHNYYIPILMNPDLYQGSGSNSDTEEKIVFPEDFGDGNLLEEGYIGDIEYQISELKKYNPYNYSSVGCPNFGLIEEDSEQELLVQDAINNFDENENIEQSYEQMDILDIQFYLGSNRVTNENFDSEKYQQAIFSINTENVLHCKPFLKANRRGVQGYNLDLIHLGKVLFKKAKQLGVDTSDIEFKTYSKKDIEVIKEGRKKIYCDGSVIQENQDLLDSLYERLDDAVLAQKNAQVKEVLVYKNRDLLKEATEFKYAELNGQTKPKNAIDIDFGNGECDKPSDQETGNCWVHAPLVSIASTKEGNNMLKTHKYRDENLGVTAIHIKEAEDRGKGYKGQGIFMITDAEIAEAQEKVSSGDGDIVAYNLAIQKYLIETEGRTDLNGGWPETIFEIITGMEPDMQSMDVNGISSNIQTLYEDVLSMAKDGTGATTICIDITGVSNYLGYSRGGGHVLSIVGATDDGNLLVQESNNDGLYISDLPQYSGKTFNGAPTYVMDKETYYNRVLRTDHFYWGA